MKEWTIKDYQDKPINWDELPSLTIDEYPWYVEGLKQDTSVKIAIANDEIHIWAKAQDKHIRAKSQNLNDPVYIDSCFEFFVTPWGEKSGKYLNMEVSCKGVLYMAYQDGKGGKVHITEQQAQLVSIQSTLEGVENVQEVEDWELKIILPIAVLEELSGEKIEKDLWYGNFYRCGGEIDDQYAAWNSLEFEKPNYHLPMQFGKLIIK